MAEAVGLGAITFLPVELWIILLLGGMLLGSVGGLIVARSVSRSSGYKAGSHEARVWLPPSGGRPDRNGRR